MEEQRVTPETGREAEPEADSDLAHEVRAVEESAAPLTRAQRRALRDKGATPAVVASGDAGEVVASPGRGPHPLVFVTMVALGAFLIVTAEIDLALVAGAVGFVGAVLAFSWSHLTRLPAPMGSFLAIAVAAAGTTAAAVALPEQPLLQTLPIVVTVAFLVMVGHQLARRSGRERLTESLGSTALGLAFIVLGAGYVTLARGYLGAEMVAICVAATVLSGLGDLVAAVPALRAWQLPLSMIAGGAAAVIVSSIVAGPAPARALLLGFVCAGVAHAVRRLLAPLPGHGGWPGQIAAGAASLLSTGLVGFLLAGLLNGR